MLLEAIPFCRGCLNAAWIRLTLNCRASLKLRPLSYRVEEIAGGDVSAGARDRNKDLEAEFFAEKNRADDVSPDGQRLFAVVRGGLAQFEHRSGRRKGLCASPIPRIERSIRARPRDRVTSHHCALTCALVLSMIPGIEKSPGRRP